MTQPALIPGTCGMGFQPVKTGKRGRGGTPVRSSADPGAPRFVAPTPNLTGDREMTFAFRPLKYWPDNGDQGLPIAFHFFKKLGCLTVANDRILHGIYKCLEQYTAQELCEAIDFKAASLGETFNERRQKVTFVPQPENFFQPDSALLKKWLAKSPAWQKRQREEAAKRAAVVSASSPSAASVEALRTRDEQQRSAAAAARRAQQERETALVQSVLEQVSDVERKAFEMLVQDEHSAAEFKRIAARRFETILPADELARRVAAHVRAKRIVTVDQHGNANRVARQEAAR